MYLVLMLNSDLEKIRCKSDFEKLCKAPDNDKEFSHWLDNLANEKSLECVGVVTRGYINNIPVKGYKINFNNLKKRLKKNIYYGQCYKYFSNNKEKEGFELDFDFFK